jgi:hypothetical protein
VRRHGPNKVFEERHKMFGPHGMLYMTGKLGTFKDGNLYNLQRVNRNLYDEQSEDDHNAQQFCVLQRVGLEIASSVNGMNRGK